MKVINIPRIFKNKRYRFNHYLGWLTSSKVNDSFMSSHIDSSVYPTKVKALYKYVENPYNIKNEIPPKHNIKVKPWIKLYAHTTIWLYHHCYLGLYLFSKLDLQIFENSVDAADFFCTISPQEQKVLCLPRSIFMATTSKKFKQHGALFIGVFLPSHQMHAWVIESGVNAYRDDFMWTNFTPISIMI